MTLHLPRDRMPRPARSHAAPRGAVQRDPAHLTPRCEWRLVCGQISPPDSWFCVFSTSESRPTRYIGSSCANWLLRASTASGDSSGHCTGHKSVSGIWPQAKSDDVAPVVRHSAKCLAFLSKLYQVLCAIPIERSSRLELLHCWGAPATAAHFAHSTFVRPCSDWPKAPAQRTLCARLRAGASPRATSKPLRSQGVGHLGAPNMHCFAHCPYASPYARLPVRLTRLVDGVHRRSGEWLGGLDAWKLGDLRATCPPEICAAS